MTQDEAAEADALADEVNKLAMLFGKPERFHEIKDDVAKSLRRMAKRLRGDNRKTEPTTVWRPPSGRDVAQVAADVAQHGRQIDRARRLSR